MNTLTSQLNLQTRVVILGVMVVFLTSLISLHNNKSTSSIVRAPSSQSEQSQRDMEERAPSATAPQAAAAVVTYKITDGYAEYTGQGATKIMASEQARSACIMQKVSAYENRYGVTPDADTTDLFIDACINR